MPTNRRRRSTARRAGVDAYIAGCTSRDGARKSLRFGFDAGRFATGEFGDEADILEALRDEFADELPSGWIHRRLAELDGTE